MVIWCARCGVIVQLSQLWCYCAVVRVRHNRDISLIMPSIPKDDPVAYEEEQALSRILQRQEAEGIYLREQSLFGALWDYWNSDKRARAEDHFEKHRPHRLADEWQKTGYRLATQTEVDQRWLGVGQRVRTNANAVPPFH